MKSVAEKNVLSRSDYVNRASVALCRFRFLLGIVECVQILRMFWYEMIDDNLRILRSFQVLRIRMGTRIEYSFFVCPIRIECSRVSSVCVR